MIPRLPRPVLPPASCRLFREAFGLASLIQSEEGIHHTRIELCPPEAGDLLEGLLDRPRLLVGPLVCE